MKTYPEYLDYIETIKDVIIGETLELEDAETQIWEHADSSEHVIYYSKAHSLVRLIRNYDFRLYCEAQQEVEELNGGEFWDFDTHATKLAFSIIRIDLAQRVYSHIEKCEEATAST